MNLRVQVTAVALAFAGIGACSLPVFERPARETARREFFPLHPGTLWVYEVRDAQGQIALERVLVRGSLYLKAHDTAAVVVEESGGMSGEFDLDVSWHPIVYYRRGEFLYKYSGLNEVEGELRELPLGQGEEKVLPADPTANREWESDFQIFQMDRHSGYGARMVSVAKPSAESVRVRAGTFRGCLRVDSQSELASQPRPRSESQVTFYYTDWYAPGVGLVKSEVRESANLRPVSTMELISFRDGKGSD